MAITKTQKTLEKQGWAIKFNMAATGSNKVIATKGQKTVNGTSVTDVYKKIKAKYSGSLGTTKTKAKKAKKKATRTAKRKGIGSTKTPSKGKYDYEVILQQNYGSGWDDVEFFTANSQFVLTGEEKKRFVAAKKDYQKNQPGISLRSIHRKTKKSSGIGSTPKKRKTAKKKATGSAKRKGVGSTPRKRKTAKKRVTKKQVGNPKHKVSKAV